MALFSLDYDATYTLDPDFWLEFVKNAKARGHEVICVTMRYDWNDDLDPRLKELVRVVFTGHQQKRAFCARLKILPHVWIDDMPEYIVRNGGSDYC